MSVQDGLRLISNMLPTLKGVEEKIASFIINNPETFINMTISKIAKSIHVSEGSIVRFCQRMGYDGFTALKIGVALSMKEQHKFVMSDIEINAAENAQSVVAQVFESYISVLRQTREILDADSLELAATAILQAERVEFYGLGTSAPIVQDAYYRFMRIGINATACVDPHIMLVSASQTRAGCLSIAISHTGRSTQTVAALREAKLHGAATICITSYRNSPITKHADIKLVTSPNNSSAIREAAVVRVAHIALLDSLCAYVAMQNSEKTMQTQEGMLELLEKQRY